MKQWLTDGDSVKMYVNANGYLLFGRSRHHACTAGRDFGPASPYLVWHAHAAASSLGHVVPIGQFPHTNTLWYSSTILLLSFIRILSSEPSNVTNVTMIIPVNVLLHITH
jgi:hypothetical protein